MPVCMYVCPILFGQLHENYMVDSKYISCMWVWFGPSAISYLWLAVCPKDKEVAILKFPLEWLIFQKTHRDFMYILYVCTLRPQEEAHFMIILKS